MALFTHKELKKWRMSQGVSVDSIASCLNVDASTYYRYENGTMRPDIDMMFSICKELGDLKRWCDWMRTEYPNSYGKIHGNVSELGLVGSIVSVFNEISDTIDLRKDTMKDVADGDLSDPVLKSKLRTEIEELLNAAQKVKILLTEE